MVDSLSADDAAGRCSAGILTRHHRHLIEGQGGGPQLESQRQRPRHPYQPVDGLIAYITDGQRVNTCCHTGQGDPAVHVGYRHQFCWVQLYVGHDDGLICLLVRNRQVDCVSIFACTLCLLPKGNKRHQKEDEGDLPLYSHCSRV